MKNKITLITITVMILVIFPLQTSKGQLITESSSGINTAAQTTIMVTQLGTMIGVIENMEKAQKKIAKAVQFIEHVQKVKEAVKLLDMIASTVCTMKNYQFCLEYSIGMNNCFVDFEYKVISARFGYATNIVGIATQSNNFLSSGERINSIKDAINMLNQTMEKVNHHNKRVEGLMIDDIMADYNQELESSFWGNNNKNY